MKDGVPHVRDGVHNMTDGVSHVRDDVHHVRNGVYVVPHVRDGLHHVRNGVHGMHHGRAHHHSRRWTTVLVPTITVVTPCAITLLATGRVTPECRPTTVLAASLGWWLLVGTRGESWRWTTVGALSVCPQVEDPNTALLAWRRHINWWSVANK